ARPGAHWMGPPYRTATRHAIAPTQMRRSRAAIDIDPAGGSRAIATREAPASESERVDERLKRRRLMTSAWIVQEVAVERRAPVLEDPHEPAARYVFGHVFLEQESQSQSVQRSTERERGVAEDEGPRHGHSDGLAPLLELPSIDGPAGADAVGDAAVRRQVPRRFRLRVRVEVRRRGDDGRALLTGDLDGDHVALHELAEVNAGIEAPGDQIGAAVPFGRDVEHHLGVVADELRELRPHDHRDRHG